MEPLRVLELYSGIGGMHHALRGERGPNPSLWTCSRRGAERRRRGEAERRKRRGGAGAVVALGCPGNGLARGLLGWDCLRPSFVISAAGPSEGSLKSN